jgi:hypothetical protein
LSALSMFSQSLESIINMLYTSFGSFLGRKDNNTSELSKFSSEKI